MFVLNQIKNNKILYSTLFIIIILLGVLFSYQYIFQTYFAMDEWSFWMHFLKYGPFYVIKQTGLIGSLTGGVRFGLDLTNGIYFSLFRLNITPWHITFLTLHLINIFLLYKILRKFSLPPFSAFLASFYFAVASAGQEALSWPAAGMQVLGSTPFILIAVLLTINFNESKKKILLVLAILSAYLSFLMRPTGIVTIGLIITLIFLFYKRRNLIHLPRAVVVLGISTFVLGLFRFLIEYQDKLSLLTKAGFNVIFYPLVSLSHIFIPWRLMFRLSDGFINFYYPDVPKIGSVSYLIVGDFISVLISLFLLFCIFLLYKRVNKFYKKVLIFGLIFFFLQFFVIALFYINRDWFTYLASRHMYIPSIGISIILGVLFNFIFTKYKSIKSIKRYIYIVLLILFGVWLYQDMTVAKQDVRGQAMDDIPIKKTYESLESLRLPNSNKMIIFLQSDRNYYSPDWHLPFKLAPPYMISLALYGGPFIDRDMLGDPLLSQSKNTYINSNNKQFGYFTDIKPLAHLIKQGKIDINNVVGLHFIDGPYTFEVTTDKTRKLIENELLLN